MRFTARVVTGNQVGGPFGIATANLEPHPEALAHGVYIVDAVVGEKPYEGILHHGPRKTFLSDITTELHLLHYNGSDLYEQTVTVEIRSFVRPVQQFQNADALFTQIEKDILITEKYFLRRSVRSIWKGISAEALNTMSSNAVAALLQDDEIQTASKIFAYVPYKNELPFVEELVQALPNTLFCFPKTADNKMHFFASDLKDLQVGEYGIKSPITTEIEVPQSGDIMLVPYLAMTVDGQRLGKGGGYYDRYLSAMPDGIKTIAVVPDFAILEQIPTEPHDQTIDRVIVIKTIS